MSVSGAGCSSVFRKPESFSLANGGVDAGGPTALVRRTLVQVLTRFRRAMGRAWMKLHSVVEYVEAVSRERAEALVPSSGLVGRGGEAGASSLVWGLAL